MARVDYAIHLLMSVFIIFGVYQFYFWCQRQRWVPVRRFWSGLDDAIPFRAEWAWVYSFLYYPAIVYLPWMCGSPRHFNHLVMSFIALLFMQMAFFLFMPVETPAAWRSLNRGRTRSERFLLLVQSYDQSSNCFPSMHVSVATLAALHAEPVIGPWSFAFPALIAVSCVFTKQHYLIDLPAGAALGVVAFRFYRWLG